MRLETFYNFHECEPFLLIRISVLQRFVEFSAIIKDDSMIHLLLRKNQLNERSNIARYMFLIKIKDTKHLHLLFTLVAET
jgi:hypothetical protein